MHLSWAPRTKQEALQVAQDLAEKTCKNVREKYGSDQNLRIERRGNSIFIFWDKEALHEVKVRWIGSKGSIEFINLQERILEN
jgi:hypothetical protein